MSKKLLSLVVPCYNKSMSVERCLNSILHQTIIDFIEVILVDDCSTDNTYEILMEYKNKYPIVFRVIKNNKNSSVFTTRKIGIENTTGLYVGAVDPDDWVGPTYFEDLLTAVIPGNPLVHNGNILNKTQYQYQYQYQYDLSLSLLDTIDTKYGLYEYFIKNIKSFYDSAYSVNVVRYLSQNSQDDARKIMYVFNTPGVYNINPNNKQTKDLLTRNWNTMWNKIFKVDIVKRIYLPNYYINLMEDVALSWIFYMNCKNVAIVYTRTPYYYNLSSELGETHLSKTNGKSATEADYVSQAFLLITGYMQNHEKYDWYAMFKKYKKVYINIFSKYYAYLFNVKPSIESIEYIPEYYKDNLYTETFETSKLFNEYNKMKYICDQIVMINEKE